MPSAAPLPLGAQDVDPPVEYAPVQGDVVLLVLELEDRPAQLVVGERRRIGGRRVLAVVRRVARALEVRPLERAPRNSSMRAGRRLRRCETASS